MSGLLLEAYQYFAANQIELWGTIFGLAFVILNINEIVWAWPVGIISVALFAYVFWEVQLYGDFGLHIVYVILSIYGWYNWLHGGDSAQSLPIAFSSWQELLLLVLVGVVATLVLGAFFQYYTDNQFPYGDATTTVFSLIGQWQLTQKRIENWLMWIFVDVIASVIYYYKGLYITTFLYLVYLFLAVVGYMQWRRLYKHQVVHVS